MAIIAQPIDPADTALSAPATANPVTGWRRWTELFILLGGGMITTLAFTSVVPGLPKIAEHFKGADSIFSAQFVLVMAPAGMALAGLFAGAVVRALGVRTAVFLGLAITTLAGTCQLWVDSLMGLQAARFVLGASLITTDVALATIIGARFVGPARARIMGFRQAIGSVGTVCTMLLSGVLIQAGSWRTPGMLFLLPALFLMLAVVTFNRPLVLVDARRDDPSRALERFSVLNLWPIYLLAFLMTVCHAMPSFQMPFLLKEMHVTDSRLVSLVPSLSAFIGILTALVFGLIYARIGRMTFVLASVAMGLGFIGMGLAPGFGVILGFVVLEGIGAGMTQPYFASRVLDRITVAQRSQAMGFMLSAVFLGHVANPFVIKPIRDAFGMHNAFIIMGGFLVAAAAVLSVRALFTRGKATIV
ncbi:MAG: MFS transporter [Caulobacterales bacterium]|nr:MFS transporter [Caulobacterales bacterium]